MGSRADLIADIASTINREDVITDGNGARFVTKATQRLNQQLRLLEMCRHIVRPLDGPKFVVPSDFIAVHILKINADPDPAANPDFTAGANVEPLIYQPPHEISKYQFPGSVRDTRPKYYTVHGLEFELAPFVAVPNKYQIDLRYYAELKPLIEDTDTNYILEKFPDLYTKAALVYGYRHTMEFEASTAMDNAVNQDIATLVGRKEDQKYGDGPLIVPPAAHRLGGRFS